jgi:hypothetical protein
MIRPSAYTETVGMVASVAAGPMKPPSEVIRRMSCADVAAEGAGLPVDPGTTVGAALGPPVRGVGDGATLVPHAAAMSATMAARPMRAGRPGRLVELGATGISELRDVGSRRRRHAGAGSRPTTSKGRNGLGT